MTEMTENPIARSVLVCRHSGIAKFIGKRQISAMLVGAQSEEGKFFIDKIRELSEIVALMPMLYEQDGLGNAAIVHLHYFKNGADWYITERDSVLGEPQYQAFGLADLFGDGGEFGNISIQELIENHVELDLYWTPKTLRECRTAL